MTVHHWRYVYRGDGMTDPALVGRLCDPVRRSDGRCIVSVRMATALVMFAGEDRPRVVKRRRLRVVTYWRSRETGAKISTLSRAEYIAAARAVQ